MKDLLEMERALNRADRTIDDKPSSSTFGFRGTGCSLRSANVPAERGALRPGSMRIEATGMGTAAGASEVETTAGATGTGPPVSAGEMEPPAGVARPRVAPSSDDAGSGGKSSMLRRSYRLDSWSSQEVCGLVLHDLLPNATDQDSCCGVELYALHLGTGVKSKPAAGTSLGLAPSKCL